MKRFLIALVGLFPIMAFSNSGIRGIVKDSHGELLIGANVLIEGSYVGTSTNLQGEFFLPVRPGNYVLRTTFIGYDPVLTEVVVTEEVFVEVVMKPSSYLAEEIIVSALRAGSKTPLTYTNLSKSELQRGNLGQDIPYLLSMTPSLVASSDAGAGIGYTSFRIRGTDMTRINVTINGIPVNDSESHGVWWVNMPDFASSVENVQIQRGVGSSTNGAAAFGATVNLQTSSLKKDPYAEINSAAGSFNTLKNTVNIGTGLVDGRFSFDGRLSKIQSDGYIDRASSDLKSFFLSGSYYSHNTILTVKAFSGKEITYQAWDGVPSSLLETNRTYNGIGRYTDINGQEQFYDNETDNYQQNHFQFLFSREFRREVFLNAALHYTRGYGYYEQYKENQRFSSYGLSNPVIGGVSIARTNLIRRKILDNHFFGATWSLNFKPNRLDIFLGGALNRYMGDHYGHIIWAQYAAEIPKNYQWYLNRGDKTDINSFVKLNLQFTNRLNVFADVQYRYVNYKMAGFHDDLTDISQKHSFGFFNPKLGLNYLLSGTQDVYLSYSQGNREPSRSDFRDAKPGMSPKPEKLHNVELGYRFRSPAFSFSPNLYYMAYKDQLVLTGEINDVGAPMTTNVPESYRMGIELAGAAILNHWLKMDFHAALSRNKIKDFTEYVDNWDYDPGDPAQPLQFENYLGETDLAFSPMLVAGGTVTLTPFKQAEIAVGGKYVGKQYIDNTSNNQRLLNPYFVNDLRLNYAFRPGSIKEARISLMVNNLFNVKYETNAWIYRYYFGGEESFMDGYFPQAGIHFLAGLSILF
jgi:iron complex outermembrane recepter protein